MSREPRARFPIVTVVLLALNGLAFLYELALGADLEPFLFRWGTVPPDVRAYFVGQDPTPAATVTILTGMFLHAGWVHLAANMLYLWIFGTRVERAFGPPRFLAVYLLAGVAGGVFQIVAAPDLVLPAIGASGAIAGLLGAYLVLYPGATIGTLAPRLFYSTVRDLSAAALLVLWLVSQFFTGALAITETALVYPVGWWAHVGGFAAGLVLGVAFLRSHRRARAARQRSARASAMLEQDMTHQPGGQSSSSKVGDAVRDAR